jgi:hypothetical protein
LLDPAGNRGARGMIAACPRGWEQNPAYRRGLTDLPEFLPASAKGTA